MRTQSVNLLKAGLFSVFFFFLTGPLQAGPSKQTLFKQTVWKSELRKVLKDISLNPVPSLSKDARCQIDIKGENILEELCDSYLAEKDIKAMALTVRFARGLRCLSQTQVVMLSRAVRDYIQTLSTKKSSPRGLACIANVALLLNDMFPKQNQAPLWNTFQTYGPSIIQALAQHENKEVGLWCSDHTSGAIQFKGTTDRSVRPVSAMIETLGNSDRMSAVDETFCSCQEIAANGFYCRHGMVPCPGGGDGDRGGATGTEGPREEGVENGPPEGEPRGEVATRMAQAANQSALEQIADLLAQSCSKNGGGLAEAVGSTFSGGACADPQEVASTLPRTRQIKVDEQCVRDSDAGRLWDFRSPEDVYMDPSCGVMDGGGQDGGTPRPPPRDQTPQDACRARGVDRAACEEARRQGAERINSEQSQTALQQQCQRAGRSNCSVTAISNATQQAVQGASTNSQYNSGKVQRGRAGNIIEGTYDPATRQITLNGPSLYDPTTWAHELYHAATHNGGFGGDLLRTDRCASGSATCSCDSSGCFINLDHVTMERSHLPYLQPCPDCPDNCSENDLRNSEAFQCTDIAERLMEPNSPERNPQAHVKQRILGRWINPPPDDPGKIDPELIPSLGLIAACSMGSRRATEMGDGCGTRMQPTPDNPDCARYFEAVRGAAMNPLYDSQRCSQINCSEDRDHPCCGQACPEGEELRPGPNGIECRPQTPGRAPTGPSPEGSH